MNDTEIINWIENNSNDYLIVPPKEDEDWSIYLKGHIFVSRGKTLRECMNNLRSEDDRTSTNEEYQ
jgi:hypothetical protein